MSVTGLPTVTVMVNGARLIDAARQSLGTVHVQQRLGLPSQCELVFYHPPAQPDVGSALTLGAALRVQVADHATPLFDGEVTALETVYGPSGDRELRVRGYDALHRLRKQSPLRVHVDVTPLALAQEMAAPLGLAVVGDSPGPRWPRLIQHDRDDLALLTEVAGRAGMYATLREGTLHLITLAGMGTPLPLTLGDTLLEAAVEANSAASVRAVDVAGWNALEVEAHQGRADRAQSGRSVGITAEQVGGSGQGQRSGRTVLDHRHAELLAQATLDRHTAQEVTLWGVAAGNPALRPGTPVEVAGLLPAQCGRYVLTGVIHHVDGAQGFVSELTTAPPALSSAAPPREIATLGMVTQVNDPQGLGRIRVRLPAYADLESAWMPVLLPGVAASKGVIALPDVGDRVLVLLPAGDAGEGVVLGGLAGQPGMPDPGVDGNAVRRYTFRTPGGQHLLLDDGGTRIRLEDATGSYVELSPQQVLIHAARGLTLEAPGQPIAIRGQTIDFTRA